MLLHIDILYSTLQKSSTNATTVRTQLQHFESAINDNRNNLPEPDCNSHYSVKRVRKDADVRVEAREAKFKQQADSDNEKEKSASPVTPARHRSRKVGESADLKDAPESHFSAKEVTEKMPDSLTPELFEDTSDKFIPEELDEHSPELPINGETLQQLADLEEQVRDLENDKYV
ncbi:hypothetical protein C0J52_04583 [Blattella germanica]|nr:hypothetical protein C0J52_04583 [Blattella germanica]